MKYIAVALPSLAVLIIRRDAAAAMLLDVIGGPVPRWQLSALGWLAFVEAGLVCTVGCVAWLVWYWYVNEHPKDKRQP